MGRRHKRKLRKAMRTSLQVLGAFAFQALADYVGNVAARKTDKDRHREGSSQTPK